MTYLEALTTTLAAEHAAIYVYGALGAQTSRSAEPALFAALSAAYTEHVGRRDHLSEAIRGEGADPVAAEVAYELPADLGSVALVRRRALRLEEDCARTYAYLVASSASAQRRWAVTALSDAAVRQLSFGGVPELLPGT